MISLYYSVQELVPETSTIYRNLDRIIDHDRRILSFSHLEACEYAIKGLSDEYEKERKMRSLNEFDKNIYQILLDIINSNVDPNNIRLDMYIKQKHINLLSHSEYLKLSELFEDLVDVNSVTLKFKEKYFI